VARPIHERLEVLKLWRAGHSGKGIARATGIPRSTLRYWLRHFAGVAQSAEAADLKSAQWGFESLHQHHHPVYVYLLGLYLGDGCITRSRRTYVLRIFLNDGQPHVVAEATRAISQLVPIRRVGLDRRGRCVIVRSYWGGWPAMLPQHGPGRKHRRTIALQPWQEVLVAAHPGQFVRGCIHSDGCRHRRVVRNKNYPAYAFSNRSNDIRGLFVWACGLLRLRYTRPGPFVISIARRPDVAQLDVIMTRSWGDRPEDSPASR
jgi:Homeodomain-like domain